MSTYESPEVWKAELRIHILADATFRRAHDLSGRMVTHSRTSREVVDALVAEGLVSVAERTAGHITVTATDKAMLSREEFEHKRQILSDAYVNAYDR